MGAPGAVSTGIRDVVARATLEAAFGAVVYDVLGRRDHLQVAWLRAAHVAAPGVAHVFPGLHRTAEVDAMTTLMTRTWLPPGVVTFGRIWLGANRLIKQPFSSRLAARRILAATSARTGTRVRYLLTPFQGGTNPLHDPGPFDRGGYSGAPRTVQHKALLPRRGTDRGPPASAWRPIDRFRPGRGWPGCAGARSKTGDRIGFAAPLMRMRGCPVRRPAGLPAHALWCWSAAIATAED